VTGARATALPPAFSLLNSEFNDFLFAPIGAEGNDMALTVLSALARLGIDPWQESARLAQLSTEKATQRLTAIVSGLPDGGWAPADAGAIAARLIALLPAARVARSSAREAEGGRYPARSWIVTLLLVAVLGSLAFAAMRGHLLPGAVDADSPASDSSPAPPVPLGR
jgi:hypothetical protein